jgi:hypothetical protein
LDGNVSRLDILRGLRAGALHSRRSNPPVVFCEGIICSVLFSDKLYFVWNFQEQTQLRALEGVLTEHANSKQNSHALEHGNFKVGLQETERKGVAYDRHGNTLVRGTRYRKQGLLRHTHKRANQSQKGPPGPKALDHAFSDIMADQDLGHLRLESGSSRLIITNKIFCYVISSLF